MATNNLGFSEEAGVSGFQGIETIRGRLVEMKRVPSKFGDTTFGDRVAKAKDQIQVTLEDAVVLSMFDDAEPVEITDGRFTFWIPFAPPGVLKAPANSVFQKCWVETAKKAYGKTPSQLIGEVVTLKKIPVTLFQRNKTDSEGNPILDAEGKPEKEVFTTVDSKTGRPRYFCFVKDEDAVGQDTGIADYIKQHLAGLNLKAAKRELLVDARLKLNPQLVAELDASPIAFAEKYGLKFDGEQFTVG